MQGATTDDGDRPSAAGCSTTCASSTPSAEPLGSFGAVVGATIPDAGHRPRLQRPDPGARVRRPGRHHGRHRPDLRRRRAARRPELVAGGAAARPRPRRDARRRRAGQRRAARPDRVRRRCADAGGRSSWSASRCCWSAAATTTTRSRAYCEEVEAQRRSRCPRTWPRATATGLIEALPEFEKLAAKAPDDIQRRVGHRHLADRRPGRRTRGRRRRPATYDRKQPPAGSPTRRRTRSTRPRRPGHARDDRRRSNGVEQQARDVCKTPLTL